MESNSTAAECNRMEQMGIESNGTEQNRDWMERNGIEIHAEYGTWCRRAAPVGVHSFGCKIKIRIGSRSDPVS